MAHDECIVNHLFCKCLLWCNTWIDGGSSSAFTNAPPLSSVAQLNPVCNFLTYSLNIHINIIFPFMSRSSKKYHPLRFSDSNPACISFASFVLHVPPNSNTYEGFYRYVQTYPRNCRTNAIQHNHRWWWRVLVSLGFFPHSPNLRLVSISDAGVKPTSEHLACFECFFRSEAYMDMWSTVFIRNMNKEM